MVPGMKSCLVFLLLAAWAGSALAQYKCTGANGQVTFQQEPCVGARTEEKLVVVPNGAAPAASSVKAAPAAPVRPVKPVPAASAPLAPASAPAGPVIATPSPNGNAAPSADKKMLARYELMHQRDEIAQTLKAAQDDKASRGKARQEATAAARKKFGDDPAHAAALRDELASIDRRYDALEQLDQTRIDAAQAKLDLWEKALAPKK